jgi:hypothetical protein
MVKVKALQRVYYSGKEYGKDDELDVSEREAVTLGALRKVMRPEQEAKKTPEEKAEPKPEAKTKTSDPGKYSRRDQRAED